MSSLDSAESFDENSSEILGYSDEGPKKRGRKTKTASEDESFQFLKKPLKTSFDEEKLPEGLKNLLATQKQYGVRYDLSEVILEALGKISEETWAAFTEEKIPMNVKLMAALEDPEMREKLMGILNAPKPPMN